MSEPTLDPLVQRALLSNDVVYEVLPCDPDMADTAAFCAHYGGSTFLEATRMVFAACSMAKP